MSKLLWIIGSIMSLFWGLLTLISHGLPSELCLMIDKATGHLFTDSILRMANGFFYDVNNNEMPTVVFLWIFVINFLLYAVLIFRLPSHRNRAGGLAAVIFFSVLFRLVLLPGVLIHENDIYRYLWDGKVATAGVNPYKYAPSDLWMYEMGMTEDYYDEQADVIYKGQSWNETEQKELQLLTRMRQDNPVFFYRIGHKQVPTIYPPFAQWVFSLGALIKADSIILMKAIFAIFDLGVVFLIIQILKHFRLDPARALIYGWSPLVLREYPNSGHYDPVAIFGMMLAMYGFIKRKSLWSAFGAVQSILSKFFAVLLIPFVGRSWRLRDFLICLAVLTAAYGPYIFWGQTGAAGVFEGLQTYNREWAYNGSVFALVYAVYKQFIPIFTGSYFPAKVTCGIIFLGAWAFMMLKKRGDDLEMIHRCFLTIAGLFMINPVGDPWYYCWVIPFLCLFPYRSWLWLSGMLVLSYLNFRSDIVFTQQEFFHIPLVSWIIYGSFFILVIIEKTACRPWLYCYERPTVSEGKSS